eukprot:TRINITY_DN6177_c0_g1_i1.p1 TRINITY_DN6177_c0_g1~~TRINITY_DN6177_c0_g1_i1.p1  ORF type:complete len:148 (-),score=21.40 TRINITY_DN6177_c0_g1_i1:15-458(-)
MQREELQQHIDRATESLEILGDQHDKTVQQLNTLQESNRVLQDSIARNLRALRENVRTGISQRRSNCNQQYEIQYLESRLDDNDQISTRLSAHKDQAVQIMKSTDDEEECDVQLQQTRLQGSLRRYVAHELTTRPVEPFASHEMTGV